MLIVKLSGGLGNQLFQYAAAKALAEKNVTDLKADSSYFTGGALRNFELSRFNTSFTRATNEDIKSLKADSSFKRVRFRLTPYRYKTFYKEPYFHYDRNFFRLPSTVYIQGYFQSEKYFCSVEPIIRKELKIDSEVSLKHTDLVRKMSAINSVSIHIRRGDYKNETAMEMHGILSAVYYQKAIELISQKCDQPKFYIFSDDVDWVASQLQLTGATIVSGNYSTDHLDDFYLMSQCRHNIIANSSFSWWAAWLNPNPDKIVIAPKQWFNKGPKDTQDLLPESWIKL